jgi:hypothetical protein
MGIALEGYGIRERSATLLSRRAKQRPGVLDKVERLA